MSSLILHGAVLATGNFTETASDFRGPAVYSKATFAGAHLVEAEPPAPGAWSYSDGVFTDLSALKETQRVQTVTAKASEFDTALTAYLDSVAKTRRYDNRITCSLRAGYPGPFQAEGLAFAAWMDQCNATAYTLMGEVFAGTRPLPNDFAEVQVLLPEMVWPA